MEACPRNPNKLCPGRKRLDRTRSQYSEKKRKVIFTQLRIEHTACTACHLLWLASVPAVTNAELYVHFHLSLQYQAEGKQHPFYHMTMLVS